MDNWIVTLDVNQEQSVTGVVVIFHHAGGAASNYVCYRQSIPSCYRLLICQLPGRESHQRNQLCYSADEAASQILQRLERMNTQLPVIFWGHSMGASLAWKTATLVQQQSDIKLIQLVLSARRPPHVDQFEPNLMTCDDEQVVQAVCHYGLIDPSLLEDAEFRQDLITKVRADFAVANSTQQVGLAITPLPLPITVLGGDLDDTVDLSHLSQWAAYSLKKFKCVLFPGDHFYLFKKNNQAMIGKVLSDAFTSYQAGDK